MVGLSIVLESQKVGLNITNKSPQVINKTTIASNKPSSSSFSSSYHSPFLDQCFLCRHRLSHRKDIYMYKGDRAFCSEECRWKHIYMEEEEEESLQNKNCCVAAMRPTSSTSSSSSSSKPPQTRAFAH